MGARNPFTSRKALCASLAVALWAMTASVASADGVARGAAAFHRGDYVRAARELAPAAERGNPRALGLLGFMYEHGFGVPQAYAAAADLYYRGAVQGDPFAQAQLGLIYDKGHGVPTDFVLAYKWLNLAAARAGGRQRDAYLRFRDAVASKLSTYEIIAGQRFALEWVPDRPAPDVHLTVR
ncbi:Sel1 repeat-containing protein [Bradyrhizobium macuxiense]|uniref:Sel1 repeat-containing protein n=2 Tax=Bradyrhizobium macuxiense TaxID=1755647 RepID=A0A560LKH5_9BRAD|nr:Sel1 repeat-containing protein [Bradyrhizobium macuxiense]